jgi:hypothetical protein
MYHSDGKTIVVDRLSLAMLEGRGALAAPSLTGHL